MMDKKINNHLKNELKTDGQIHENSNVRNLTILEKRDTLKEIVTINLKLEEKNRSNEIVRN